MKIFDRKVKIVIIDDHAPVLERLKGRISTFWPPDIPVKTTAVYCGWAEEAVEAIKEFQPDILLLNYAFERDQKTGRDVARWIDRNYRAPIDVAIHSDRSEEDLRQLFSGIKCVKYFISGDRVRDFIDDLMK